MIEPGSDIYPTAYPGLAGFSRMSRAQVAWLVAHVPPTGRFLEIGSASGVTAALVADARQGATVVCVDAFYGFSDAELVAEEGERIVNWRRNQRPNMNLWCGTVQALKHALSPAAQFDAILVDADHSYDCTLGCLRESVGLLRPAGVILAHDWRDPNWPEVEPAVVQFCREAGFVVASQIVHMCALRRGS